MGKMRLILRLYSKNKGLKVVGRCGGIEESLESFTI
jgi:hypothetical protein